MFVYHWSLFFLFSVSRTTVNLTRETSAAPSLSTRSSSLAITSASHPISSYLETTTTTSSPGDFTPVTVITTPSGVTSPCGPADQDRIIADPANCAKFIYCYSNSTFVSSDCGCEQMFSDDSSTCQPCDLDFCDSCRQCSGLSDKQRVWASLGVSITQTVSI